MDEEQKNEIERRKIDSKFAVGFCLFFIAVAAYFLLLTGEMEKFHPTRILGPGAFPFGILVVIIGLLVWLLIQVITGKGGSAKLPNHIDIPKVKRSLFLFARVFVVILLLAPLDLLISLPGMFSRKLMISAPTVLEQGANAVIVITTVQKRRFPARCMKIWMRMSGDYGVLLRRHILSAMHDYRYLIELDASKSGITSFSIKRMWAVSLLGLFSLPSPVRFRASTLVLPPPMKPPHTIALPRGVIFRPKPGGGFAEDYDLRPYRQADPIRSIHWKISAKHDSLIIREPLVPPPHSRLVVITRWTKPKDRDLILARLRWVSNYLLKWELPFFVRFGEDGEIAEIANAEDLTDYLYRELCNGKTSQKTPRHDYERFTWVFVVTAGGTEQSRGLGDAESNESNSMSL